MTPAESLARRIAVDAHHGQTDQAGEPYLGHVERVVARLEDPLDRAEKYRVAREALEGET